jgi:adenosylcobinamide-GDP ribazoletransferase
MKPFWLALQFLTRLPVPAQSSYQPRDWGRSVLAYPLVGLLLGLILAALHYALKGADFQLQAALLVAAWALLTGGLHLDGLADSADAWIGGHGDPGRTLEIMKDPRTGPAGVVAIVLVLLVKFAALAALLKTPIWPVLVLAPVLGRTALIGLALTTPYVRPGGLGAALTGHLPRKAAVTVLLAVAAAVLFFAGWSGASVLLTVSVTVLLLRQLMVRRIRGMTGDTLGASVELLEALALVALALQGS